MMAVREQTGFNILEFPPQHSSPRPHILILSALQMTPTGAKFLIVKLLRKTANQNNKTFLQYFLINLDQVYKSKVKTCHTMKVE